MERFGSWGGGGKGGVKDLGGFGGGSLVIVGGFLIGAGIEAADSLFIGCGEGTGPVVINKVPPH